MRRFPFLSRLRARWVFPLFNAPIGAMFGAAIGYYTYRPWMGALLGAVSGLALGALVEAALGARGTATWIYRRRVLLTALIEVPLAVFLLGPYVYVLAATQPDPHAVCCETPLDYGAATYESVRIHTPEGIVLAGWYVPPAEPPGPAVVLLHGSGADRLGTAWHARELIGAGYGVLMYDQRALGESTGDRTSLGWLDGLDLVAAIDDLEGRPEVVAGRIGAVGISGGGHIALNTAAAAPGRMAALWLDGIQVQGMEDFPEAEDVGERFAILMNGLILDVAEWRLGRETPPAFVRLLPTLGDLPVVMVVAGQDAVERRCNEEYARVVGPAVEMWVIANAPHAAGPLAAPDEYSSRMIAFFDAHLR